MYYQGYQNTPVCEVREVERSEEVLEEECSLVEEVVPECRDEFFTSLCKMVAIHFENVNTLHSCNVIQVEG